MEEDMFYRQVAAVKCEENDQSSLPVTRTSVKQEPVDVDETLTIPPAPVVFVDSLMPKSELEDASRSELQEMETDPLLFPNMKQEDTGERSTSGQRATSSRIKREPAELQDAKEEDEGEEAVLRSQVFACEMCKETFESEEDLEMHSVTHNCFVKLQRIVVRNSDVCYACDACNRYFGTRVDLTRHILDRSIPTLAVNARSELSALRRSQQYPQNFSCHLCERNFSKEHGLKRHILAHARDHISFACEKCDTRCKTKARLVSHMQVHLNSDPLAFPSDRLLLQCNDCEKKFVLKSLLTQHVLSHAPKRSKTFVCDNASCARRFVSKRHLKDHKTIHSKVKSFACVKCDYRCKFKSRLKIHMQVHLNSDPLSFPSDHLLLQCSACEKKFVTKSLLSLHLSSHARKSSKTYICDTASCGMHFVSKGQLHEHRQAHRPFHVNSGFTFACHDPPTS